MNRLYIDGEEADISPGTRIAITYQGYNPLTPNQIGVSYSNRFRIPLTSNNRTLIGLTDNVNSQSQILKTLIPIRFVQEGVEVIPSGSLKVEEITKSEAECVIFTELDFYSVLKERSLNDLDYTDINPANSTSSYKFFYDIRAAAEIAGGAGEYFSAVINLGQNIVNNGGTIEYINNDIILVPANSVFLPLFFGYKQVLQRIIADAGFSYDWGKLFDGVNDNPKFNSLAIMQQGYSGEYRWQYSESFRDEVEFTALVDADETFTDIGVAATRRFFFKNEVQRADFYYPDASGAARSRYVVANADTANGYFIGIFRFKGVVNRTGNAASVSFFVNGTASTGAGVQVLNVGDNNVDIYLDYTNGPLLKDGDIIEVGYTQVGANSTVVTYYAGGEFSFECVGGPLNNTSTYIYLNQLLPPLNQLSVIKDFLFRFGQVPKFSNGEVSFKSIKDILDTPTSVNDWTAKRDKSMGSHEVHLNLAQRNFYRYESSDDLTSEGFRQGYFDLDDTTLDVEGFYTSIWSSTFDALTENIKTGQLEVQETPAAAELAKFMADTGARLLMTRLNYATEPDLVMGLTPDDTPQTSYTVACFSKVDTIEYERSLGYDLVLREWYTSDGTMSTGFLERLKDAKVVTRYYNLNVSDIYLLDPHKMIFDDGVQFMFPKIKNFVPGKVTEVEMLKL